MLLYELQVLRTSFFLWGWHKRTSSQIVPDVGFKNLVSYEPLMFLYIRGVRDWHILPPRFNASLDKAAICNVVAKIWATQNEMTFKWWNRQYYFEYLTLSIYYTQRGALVLDNRCLIQSTWRSELLRGGGASGLTEVPVLSFLQEEIWKRRGTAFTLVLLPLFPCTWTFSTLTSLPPRDWELVFCLLLLVFCLMSLILHHCVSKQLSLVVADQGASRASWDGTSRASRLVAGLAIPDSIFELLGGGRAEEEV